MEEITLEAQVTEFFCAAGFEVTSASAHNPQYDFSVIKAGKKIAVRLKRKEKLGAAQLEKFQNFLEAQGEGFTAGCLVSLAGFTKAALTHVERERPQDLMLLTVNKGRLASVYPYAQAMDDYQHVRQRQYIGVFTAKGGVGKTTTAAHLAGAFALMGQSVILVDLDPDKNLRKLFLQDPNDPEGEAYLHVPAAHKDQTGATIRVLTPEQWRESRYPDVHMVICDCSPVMSENPSKLVKRFDVCIVPTTLNPLGVAKHSDVMIRTFRHIRAINDKALLLALINHYDASKDAQKRNEVLFAYLQRYVNGYALEDERCQLIPPDQAKIRHSMALFYWGYHIIEGTVPQLAFKETAGKSHPRSDFLQLADYIEQHSMMITS